MPHFIIPGEGGGGAGGIPDAPLTGDLFARRNGAWEAFEPGSGGVDSGDYFALKLKKTGLNIDIDNNQSYDLLSLISLTDLVADIGRPTSDYTLTGGGILKLPLPRGTGLVTYDIELRISGTIGGGVSPTTAREISIRMMRPDGVSMLSALPLVKVGGNPLEHRSVIFNTYTNTATDPFIVDGLRFRAYNFSGSTMNITGIEVVAPHAGA